MSSSPPPSRRRWFVFAAVAVVFGLATWYFATRPQQTAERGWNRGPNPAWATTEKGPPLIPVRVVPAERRALPVHLKAIGTVTPLNTVTVRSRVDGQLLRILFEEGQRVRKGARLAAIDPASYEIALSRAEGQLQQNASQLENALRDLERLQQLMARNLVSAQEIEAQQALVRQRRGALAADQANVDNARLQLAYTRIEAPISGRLGLRLADEGNLIRGGDSGGIVVITQTQPISVVFTIPEIELSNVLQPLRAGEELQVEAWDRSERTLLTSGVLRAVDNQIDLSTGTLRLKAEFPNTDERLFPNQFVNVRMRVRTIPDAIVIPSAAVQFGSRGTYVYVINDQDQATVRAVTLGPSDGTDQSITNGLKPGEAVVLEGLDRLREGRRVLVVKDGEALPSSGSLSPAKDS